MNRHYFINREHSEDEYFTFEEQFLNKNFKFRSCSDVFSKNELDYGSLVLIKTVIKAKILKGKTLDMCCGYGTIGIILSKFLSVEMDMCDVNSTAVELAKDNAKLNQVNINKIFESDMYNNVLDNYNHIVSNPPIKTGKSKLLEFVDGSYEHLLNDGTLTLVIKKNLGAKSLKDYLVNKFGNCEIIERDKGYYILHSIKSNAVQK